MKHRLCSVYACTDPHNSRGWCRFHYQRWRKYGDPLGGPPRRVFGDDARRFWAKVDASGSCWMWTASTNGGGYGGFTIRGTRTGAHRYAYERMVGPIPEGMDLDHLCRNRRCVRPSHLEPVTRSENVARGWRDRGGRRAAA